MKTNRQQSFPTGLFTLQNLDTQCTMSLWALALVRKPKENIYCSF